MRAVVTEERAKYLRADAVEVLTPSPHRVPEPCVYARPGRCGGCDWQHAALPYQRELKAAVVAEQLQRLAKLDREVTVEAVPGSDDGLRWRTRVRFAVRDDGVAGLHRHRSHEVEPLDFCLIATEGVEEQGVEGTRWPGMAAVDVAVSATTGESAVVPVPLGVRGVPVGPPVTEQAAGRTWQVHSTGFWQVHPAAAETLVDAVLRCLEPRATDEALDLYAGVGLFAGALAPSVARVLAVEGDRAAAEDARRNLYDLRNTRVLRANVDRRLFTRNLKADVVVLDPPRAGAGKDVSLAVAALRPRAIAYVACDPAALARDLATFAGAGYRLASLRAFDLFPMTMHVECVALLRPA